MAITSPTTLARPARPARAFGSPRSFGLAALTGLLLILSFPHADLGWLAWVALVPFLLTFPHTHLRAALAHGAVLGLAFFGGLMYWIGIFAAHAVGPALGTVAWLGSALSLAPWCILFAWGAHCLHRRGLAAWLWGVPALWTVLEWGRQFGILGTTWGDLAFTQHHALDVLQATKIAGPWGLSFLIVLVNACVAEWVSQTLFRSDGGKQEGNPIPRPLPLAKGQGSKKEQGPLHPHLAPPPYQGGGREGVLPPAPPNFRAGGPSLLLFFHLVAVLALLALTVCCGQWTLRHEHLRPAFVAAALQGNINQNVPDTPAYEQRVLDTFAAQSQLAAAQKATLTVWPETAVPGYLRLDPRFLLPIAQSASLNHQTALVGARDYVPSQRKDTNTLFVVTPQGVVTGEYSKRHLVPFGEYVPLRATFPILDKLHLSIYDMAQGGAHQPLLDAGANIGKLGAAICYDSTYSGLMRAQVARGAGLLIVTTDDTWFGRTAAAGQHAAMASVDAAATDRYLVRCAATGISQVLDPTGRVVASSRLFVPAVVSAPVQSRHTQTFYVRHGDWFVLVCAVVLAGLCVLLQHWPPAPITHWRARRAGEPD